MILPPVVGSFVAVLLLVSPVLSQEEDKVPAPEPEPEPELGDPSSFQQAEPETSSAALPPRLMCAKRCGNNCLGSPNADRCATKFISRKCRPFRPSTAAKVKSKCLAAITCLQSGNKVCPHSWHCVAREQCCHDAGCTQQSRCLNNWCAAKGSPSFTLLWSGLDDLDLHVTTPAPDLVELDYSNDYDPLSGGRFQHDDVPGDTNSTWQETVYFPSDRSAPEGTYTFYVYNNHYDPDPPRPYSIRVYEGDDLLLTKRGAVENGYASPTYTYDFVP